MSDEHRTDPPVPPSFAPPPSLPDFVKKPPSSFVPPRPPVLHPSAGGQQTGGSTNPFAPKGGEKNVDKSQFSKPVPPNFAPSIPPPSQIPFEMRASSPKPPAPPPRVPSPVAPPKIDTTNLTSRSDQTPAPVSPPHKEIPLTPSPPTASPPTSPAVLPTQLPQTVESSKIPKAEEKKEVPSGHVDMSGGLIGWITKTVTENKLLNDVAEKAKHGMEQVLTTLDPGMRGFLSDDGTVELYVVAPDSQTIRAIKEGFERVFASVLIKPVPVATANLPPLVNGSAYALELCREKTSRVFASKQVPTSAPVLVLQPFIMQIENKPYTATRLLLEWRGHLLDAFSQFLPVEEKLMQQLEIRSKADGKQAQDYSLTVSQAVKEVYSLDCESWAGPPPPFSFSELLNHGSASLALQFMNLSMTEKPVSSPSKE